MIDLPTTTIAALALRASPQIPWAGRVSFAMRRELPVVAA